MKRRIAERIAQPTPDEVRQARERSGLNQAEAAELVSAAAYKTWSGYERPQGSINHRSMPLATWELFLLVTDQHPTMKLTKKRELGDCLSIGK